MLCAIPRGCPPGDVCASKKQPVAPEDPVRVISGCSQGRYCPGDGSSVVGTYIDDQFVVHGLLHDADSSTTIDAPGAEFETDLYGINYFGVIVGAYDSADGIVHGLLLDHGIYYTLDFGPADRIATYLSGINTSGQIVGTYYDADYAAHSFLATPVP